VVSKKRQNNLQIQSRNGRNWWSECAEHLRIPVACLRSRSQSPRSTAKDRDTR